MFENILDFLSFPTIFGTVAIHARLANFEKNGAFCSSGKKLSMFQTNFFRDVSLQICWLYEGMHLQMSSWPSKDVEFYLNN